MTSATPAFSACIIIPVYNHAGGIGPTVDAVRQAGLPILLVDDGSEAECAQELDRLVSAHPQQLQLLRRPHNGGKGAAMADGFRAAAAAGYSHALQIDADGQHNADDISGFIQAAEAAPEAVICGVPIYDDSVPKSRLYGRYATHVWVWINTLSLQIRDSMCGFRVYPLAPTLQVFETEHVGARMEFDTEIIVRLFWRGVPVVNRPTAVRYPIDGVSHFAMWADNLRISRMHARLFFTMLWRLPQLLRRRVRSAQAQKS